MTAMLGTETMYGPVELSRLQKAVLLSSKREQDRPRLIAGVAEIVSPQAEAEPNHPAG